MPSLEHLEEDSGRNHEPAGDVFAMADLFVRDSLRTGLRRVQLMCISELIADEAAPGEARASDFSHDLHQPAGPLDGGSSTVLRIHSADGHGCDSAEQRQHRERDWAAADTLEIAIDPICAGPRISSQAGWCPIATGRRLTVAQTTHRPWDLGLSPGGRYQYSAKGPPNDVSVLDMAKMTVLAAFRSTPVPGEARFPRGKNPAMTSAAIGATRGHRDTKARQVA